MSVIEIISAILLILSCVFIIVIVLMQESKKGMSQTITGGSSDNYYQKNSSRTKEAKLIRATRTAAIAFFAITLLVNIVAVYFSEPDTIDLGEIPVEGSELTLDDTINVTDAPETEESETADTSAPEEESKEGTPTADTASAEE